MRSLSNGWRHLHNYGISWKHTGGWTSNLDASQDSYPSNSSSKKIPFSEEKKNCPKLNKLHNPIRSPPATGYFSWAELSTKLFMKCTFYRFWFYSLKRRFFRRKKNLFSFSASTVTILSRLNIFLLKECCWAVHCSGQTNFLFIFTVLEIQTHKYVLHPHILSIWEKVEECYHMSFSDRCCSITIHFDFYVTSKGQRSPINVCYVGICLKSCNFQDFWQDFHHIQL